MLWIKIERIVTAKIVILVFLFLQDYTVFESITSKALLKSMTI